MPVSESADSYCPLCQKHYADANVEFCRYDGARLPSIEELGKGWLGRVIDDKYRLVRYVGSGATAEVYDAEHLVLGRHVAIKLLNAKTAAEASMQARFRQEAQLVSLISHPNVVGVEDFGCLPDATLYMVMELLRGNSHVLSMMSAVPPVLGLGPGTETRSPMAAAILGGLAVSTLLSLLVVPAFYVVVGGSKGKSVSDVAGSADNGAASEYPQEQKVGELRG